MQSADAKLVADKFPGKGEGSHFIFGSSELHGKLKFKFKRFRISTILIEI
jgi:hypothetical protein